MVDEIPSGVFTKVRAWDLAASEKRGGKRTAGCLIGKHITGKFYVMHVLKGKWTPGNRDQIIKQAAMSDGKNIRIAIEQEPGSGGIAQIDALVRHLAGWRVEGIPVTGDKASRAGPCASQAERGNVILVRGPWIPDFLDECEAFPGGEYCDQVDAFSLGFGVIATARTPMLAPEEQKKTVDNRDEDDDKSPWDGVVPNRPDWNDVIPR